MLCLFCMAALQTLAQRTPATDSSRYYEKEFERLRTEALTQMQQSQAFQQLQERFRSHQQRSSDYIGTSLFVDRAQGNLSKFNASIAANGFPPMNDVFYRIGLGVAVKSRRAIVDFYYFAFGIDNKSKKGGETIRAGFSNLLQLDIGYAAVQSRSFNLYPFAGLSLRTSQLRYENKGQSNPGATNIANMFLNRQEYFLNNARIGYQAGIGFDLAIAQTKEGTRAVLFFTKAGINRPLWKERYEKDGVRIEPEIDFADWIVTAGLKFVRRK